MNSSKPKSKLIIGLGNPDKQYQNTYHNVGHLFVDYLEERGKRKEESLKTSVYMNKSGTFVKKALKKYGAKPEELLIVHDDSDIALGNYKLSFGRGAAGHHGIESVMATLKTKDFWRLRIGIRPAAPPAKTGKPRLARLGGKAGKFVLKKISAAHKKILIEVFKKAALELECHSECYPSAGNRNYI